MPVPSQMIEQEVQTQILGNKRRLPASHKGYNSWINDLGVRERAPRLVILGTIPVRDNQKSGFQYAS